MHTDQMVSPFSLRGQITGLRSASLNRRLESVLERVSGMSELGRRYRDITSGGGAAGFLPRALSELRVTYRADAGTVANIPAQGPAILVANQPFGGIEAMVLADLLLKHRPDVKIMANHLLGRVPELRELFLSVDPFGADGAARRNMQPMKEAIRWVQSGGLLVVFPAGTVSHLHLSRGRVIDPPWSDRIARIIKHTWAPVIPVYFRGANSWPFQLAGLIHSRLRTVLLPREFIGKNGKTVRMVIGEAIAPASLARLASCAALTDFLRRRTYGLGRPPAPRSIPLFTPKRGGPKSP